MKTLLVLLAFSCYSKLKIQAVLTPSEQQRFITAHRLCTSNSHVLQEDLKMALTGSSPESDNIRSYITCLFRNLNFIDSNGNLKPDEIEKTINKSSSRRELMDTLTDICYTSDVDYEVFQCLGHFGFWFEIEEMLEIDGTIRGNKMFGDRCNATWECGFNESVCVGGQCQCEDDMPVTNHINKCGKVAKVNESCTFNEQCEAGTQKTECRDGFCVCMFEMQAIPQTDGSYNCQEMVYFLAIKNVVTPQRYVDPTMIGILVAMFLMFITICVVLRLFSRARWQENRTIFNTPNPRLMNVSLLRESKLERRGSKSSARGPSRQPSMVSVRAVSPNSQGRLFLGSRRGSRGSSNVSVGSLRSINKNGPSSATHLPTSASQTLESVIVEKRAEEI